MVFFTCNSCGQCVKKAHVEKHYLTECRSCEVLSCMDCGKDFVGDDYKHHTKCVSENEKYGGKDYRANAKPNKGEVKQSQWIECVQAASSSKSVSPRVRGLLNRLADYNNIPRKKAKFEKFVQNSLKVWDASLIEQIWGVFSEAGNKQKAQSELKSKDEAGQHLVKDSGLGQRDTKGLESEPQNGEPSEAQSDKRCEGDTKKKKKKRDRHLEDQEESKEEVSVMHEGRGDRKEGEEGDTDPPKKKKKKKRDKEQQASNEGLNAEVKDAVMSDADRTNISGVKQEERRPSKTKKKEKHKKHSPEGEDETKLTDKERQMETHRELKQEESNGIKKDKRQHKHKKGHSNDENEGEMISEGDSSNAAGGDARPKMDSGEKTRKTGKDQGNQEGERIKQKRSSAKNEVGDDTRESDMDGLLSPNLKKKKRRQKDKKETSCHKDGLLLVSDEKTKKHKDDSLDQNGDNPEELVTESKVEEVEVGTNHISRKKKKKSKRTEGSADDNTNASETSDNKKHKVKDIYLKKSDPAQQAAKKKKKKRKLNSTSDENGVQLKIQDENGNFEKESPSSKTKKPHKRNLEVDSADDFQTPIKKKKQAKVVQVDENGHTAQEKSHTKKKKHP